MHKLVPLLMLWIAAACSASPESDQKGAEIIAAAKTASGGSAWDTIHVWHETGHTLLPSGETSRYEHWADVPSLKTRNASIQGSSSQYGIFDGETAWVSTNSNFEPRSGLDAKAMRRGAYIACFGFFFPNRFPAEFRFDGIRTDHGVAYDVVTVSPTGLDHIDVWIDPKSHRVFRVAYAEGQADLSDYRTVGAVTVPFRLTTSGITVQTDSIAFERVGSVSFSLAAAQ